MQFSSPTARAATTPIARTASTAPDLQGLYKQQYLPSGAPANDDRVTSAILHGRGMMPLRQ